MLKDPYSRTLFEVDAREEDVLRNCLAVTEEAKGLAVADFSTRNFERLYTFSEIARRTGIDRGV